MDIGVFIAGENYLSGMIARDLKSEGFNVRYENCLCRFSSSVDQMIEEGDLPEVFLLHPHDSNKDKCYDGIAEFIKKLPDSRFYILAYTDEKKKEPRIEGIGNYPNVTYLTEETLEDGWNNLIRLVNPD